MLQDEEVIWEGGSAAENAEVVLFDGDSAGSAGQVETVIDRDGRLVFRAGIEPASDCESAGETQLDLTNFEFEQVVEETEQPESEATPEPTPVEDMNTPNPGVTILRASVICRQHGGGWLVGVVATVFGLYFLCQWSRED